MERQGSGFSPRLCCIARHSSHQRLLQQRQRLTELHRRGCCIAEETLATYLAPDADRTEADTEDTE